MSNFETIEASMKEIIKILKQKKGSKK